MKKILFLISLLFVFALAFNEASAQVSVGSNSDYNAALADTADLTNADAATFTATIPAAAHAVTFQVNVEKVSGTVAGTVTVSASIDGTNYVAIDSASLTDASGSFAFKYDGNYYRYYKIVVTTTGTQASKVQPWLLVRRE